MTNSAAGDLPPAQANKPLTDAPLTTDRQALHPLTGIRFVAAMQAVIYHFGAGFAARAGAPAPLGRLLSNGNQAVSLFFLLSGFILTYTYAGQLHRETSVFRFWEARFARLYPVYLLALLICLPFGTPQASIAAQVLLLVQAWHPYLHWFSYSVNFPAWTLSTEAFFYLCFPAVLVPMRRFGPRLRLTALFALLALIVFAHTLIEPGALPSQLNPIMRWMPVPLLRLPEFLVGMTLGRMFLSRGELSRGELPMQEAKGKPKILAQLRLTLAVLAILLLLAFVPPGWIDLLVVPYAVLIYELACGGGWLGKILSTRTFLLLGGASYSLYLLQLPVRIYCGMLWKALAPRAASQGAELSFPLVLIGLSILVYLFVEEPSRRLLRRWFAAHQAWRGRKTAVISE